MRKNHFFIVLGILIGLNIMAWLAIYDLSRPQLLEVTFFDVGQGDAIFIETPSGRQILIDGGPNPFILEKLGEEMPFWDRTIDLVILTHPEHDHMAGLLEVLKSYKVENILWTGILKDTSEFKEWQRLIGEEEKRGAEIKTVQFPQKVNCSASDTEQCYFEILYPFDDLKDKTAENTNNTSVVAKLVFGNNCFLFTGDIYKSVEKEISEKEVDIDCQILKVSHHGSKTSTEEKFIEKVSPEIAVISAGKNNSYGHPHQETLDTLEKYGIKVFRTDLSGGIKIISDGADYKIK